MKFLFWIFCLDCSSKEKAKPELDVAVYSCNLRTWEVEARGSDYSQVHSECQVHRSAWATWNCLNPPHSPKSCVTSITVIEQHDKSSLEKKRFHLAACSISPGGSQDRNLRHLPGGRNWSRGHKGILLTGFVPHDLLSLLSYITKNHLPRGGTTHNELGPPT